MSSMTSLLQRDIIRNAKKSHCSALGIFFGKKKNKSIKKMAILPIKTPNKVYLWKESKFAGLFEELLLQKLISKFKPLSAKV